MIRIPKDSHRAAQEFSFEEIEEEKQNNNPLAILEGFFFLCPKGSPKDL